MVFQVPLWVHNEHLSRLDPHRRVACHVRVSVAESRVQWLTLCRKQIFDGLEAIDLEDVRLLQYHFSVERFDESVRGGEDWSVGQFYVLLGQTREVGLCSFCHSDRSRCQVDKAVAIVSYPLVQVAD